MNWVLFLTKKFSLEEFQDLLYDLMKQAVVGGLEVDEVVSFLNELVNVLVSSTNPASLCVHFTMELFLGDQICFSISLSGYLDHCW